MSFVQDQQKKLMEEKLQKNSTIIYEDILEIIDAFQIASAQEHAIGKTKALLSFLKQDNIKISYPNGINKTLKSQIELADLFKSIDQYIDLINDNDFNSFF